MADRLLTALLGPVAAAAGLSVGHLTAALTSPATSPVLVVGSTVIDLTPTPLKEWAIRQFGVNDKPVLVGSVVLVVLVVAALVGPLARRRLRDGVALLALLAGIAAGCALSRPTAAWADVVPAVATGCTATGVLALLVRTGRPRPGQDSSRRAVVLGLGIVAAGTLAAGGAGRWVISYRGRREGITLPQPAEPAPPLPAGLDRTVPGITPFRTSAADFYRVDTRLDVPVLRSEEWRLRIDGDVSRPYELDFAALLALPMIERDITLTCVSNSVGGPYAGGARWLGVRLVDLLERAGVGARADQLLSTDFDGMTISTPLALATDGRDAMLAVGMNGAPLPREHGFPARLVIPGLYGFISATKWVTRLTLTTYADQSAFWTDRGWATDAPIKVSSRIDTPRPLTEVPAGDVVVGGVAWAQADGGVAGVEVRVDDGPWRRANLGPSAGNDYWRQWFYRWPAEPGDHTVACRATDGTGAVQTATRAMPFPDGASGVHTITVTVA